MKLKKMFLMACLIAGSVCFGGLKAEEIVLQDLYGIMPLDNSDDSWWYYNSPPGRIVAQFNNGAVKVDFKKPAGNAHVIVSRGDGTIFQQHSESNAQSVRIDMGGAKAGRYMLEVYTDEEAVGGMFEIE